MEESSDAGSIPASSIFLERRVYKGLRGVWDFFYTLSIHFVTLFTAKFFVIRY